MNTELVVSQVGGVLSQCIGMGKHLDALVLSQVEGGVLVNRLSLARTQVVDHKAQRLLILLHQLRL